MFRIEKHLLLLNNMFNLENNYELNSDIKKSDYIKFSPRSSAPVNYKNYNMNKKNARDHSRKFLQNW